jgi:hypothetical protein
VDLPSRKKSVREEHTGKIRIHPLVKVRSPGQEVHNRIQHARDVFEGVIEILEELDPAGLAARDLLRFPEILKILMVSADTNRVFSTEKEWMAAFEAKNNTKEFLVMGVVVGFCW